MKTLSGTTLTPKRVAAAFIRNRLDAAFYVTDGVIGDVDKSAWGDVSEAIADILKPIESRLESIAKDIDATYGLAFITEDKTSVRILDTDITGQYVSLRYDADGNLTETK